MRTRTTGAALTAAALALSLTAAAARAQGGGTGADDRRVEALREATRDKVFRAAVRPHWSPDGSAFWYRNDLAAGAREYVWVDAARGARSPAFDHARLAELLTGATGKGHPADRLELDRLARSPDGSLAFREGEKGYRFDPSAGTLVGTEVPPEGPSTPDPRAERRGRPPGRGDTSPDGKLVVFVRDHNLHLLDKAGGAETPLSLDGSEANAYGAEVYWSPDSARLVAMRTTQGDHRRVNLVESSPRDRLQPKLDGYDYLKPGDQVPVARPRLFDARARRAVPVADDLAPNPYEIDDVRWAPDSSQFIYRDNERGHQVVRVIAVDAATGASRVLIDETSPTFVDYSQKGFARHLDATDEILWASERDGWNHLYLIDAKTGAVKNRVTRGDWLVRAVDRVDPEARQVWFRALGVRPGQDPYQVHYARANFDGTGLVVLTEGDGNHAAEFSPDRKYLVDTYSRVDSPPVVELRSADDGKRLCTLEQADCSRLVSAGWKPPERFVAKARDGRTDIYGVIFRPRDFDPAKKYPVIEQIYAGPQGAFVPKTFAPLHRGTETLAELGFVVVQIDGMGTNWRHKAFHDVCWKDLADAGFPDRILWLKAAAAKDPALDLTRVGLYGGSAGGQNALGGLLFHPEFYKVGAADCGCHDNRMDKIWWNEAWMGWPVGPQYAASSNVVNAHRLRGKLLLTVGEMDRNVDPSSTMQVVDALIKANKDFELIVFPGGGHGAGGSPYGDRRRRDFFRKHLLGIDPPDRNADAPAGDRDLKADAG